MKQLNKKYSVIVDGADRQSWNRIIKNFADANIYQTWDYNKIRFGANNTSHLILEKSGRIVAAAIIRIVKSPLIYSGIAYIRFGPLIKCCDTFNYDKIFRQTIRALRNEYAYRRNLFLMIFPMLFKNEKDDFLNILNEEGFEYYPRQRIEKTILINLNNSLDKLRANLKSKWRYHLKRSEKNNLEIIEGYDASLFKKFEKIYEQMVVRKRYIPSIDISDYGRMQSELPDEFKMKIILCLAENEICAGVICSAVGDTGIFLFGATSDIGLKSRGSYLLHWKIVEWLKSKQIRFYDLNGISPTQNPGTYQFKSGLGGKNGNELEFIGKFYTCDNRYRYLAFLFADTVRSKLDRFKYHYRKISNRICS